MKLVIILNPFQRQLRESYDIPFKNESIETILRRFVEASDSKHPFSYSEVQEGVNISVSGLVIPPELWGFHKPRESDEIVFIPIVAKGDTEKQILNIAVMIAVVWALGPGGANLVGVGGLGAGGAQIAGLAIIAGTGMLLQSLTPAPGVKGLNPDDWDASQVYSWAPKTTQKQGIVKQKFYGKNKLYGNAIAVHTEIDAADDTKQIMKILLGLGTGPVEGIIDGSIKVNDQNADNYSGITIEERRGLLDQTPISFFTETKPEYRPNRLVSSTAPIVYTTPDSDFDELEIELLFNRGLVQLNGQGGMSAYTVEVKVEISEADAGIWSTLVEEEITDNVTSPKRVNYVSSDTYTGGSPVTITSGTAYDIRVTKITADQTSSKFSETMYFSSVREVLTDQFEYPGLSLLAIEALATNQLSGSISLSCIQEGAIVNVYNGTVWNLEYSTNPAWVLFDIFTQPVISGDGESGTPYTVERYDGTNPDNINISKFFELAVFCSDNVSDGKGGTEERITFNGGFDIGTTVWDAALKVCEIARCIPIWSGSNLTLAIDKVGDVIQMFNVADTKEDSFKEMFMPQSELISEIEIQYRDETQDFKRVPFTILNENIPNVSRRIVLELFGIIDQSRAWRAGKHRLDQNEFLKSTISVQADIDALNSTVGNNVLIQHDVPDWGEGGRVVSGPTTTSIIVEKDMVYTSGAVHEVNHRNSDDTINENFVTTSKYNDIIDIDQGLKKIEVDGDYTDEYKDGDSVRIADSTGNDEDYTLDGDAVLNSGGTTSLFVEEAIPDATVDGGVYNLRRIVVSTPFLNSSAAPEAPAKDDLYHFGVQNLSAREYRILHIRRTSDQYVTITAVVYDERVYAADGEDPEVNLDAAINSPDSDNKNLLVDYAGLGQVQDIIPPSLRDVPFIDTPMTTNLEWTGSSGGTTSWDPADPADPILFTLNGIAYEITADSTANKYIYWDSNFTTIFKSSNVLNDSLGQGKWLMAYNDNGEVYEAWGEKIIHGAVIQAGTITAADAQIANATIGTSQLIDSAVNNAKMDDLAVSTAKIQDDAVDSDQIAALAVTSAKIDSLAVTSAKIDTLAVTSAKINDLAVDTLQIAGSAVETGKVLTAATTVNAYDNGGDVELDGSVWRTLASASITSIGGAIVVNFSCYMDMVTVAVRDVYIEILDPSSTVIWSDTIEALGSVNLIGVSASCSDQPGSGSKTYTVRAKHSSAGGAVTLYARKNRLTVEETKK